MRKLGWMMVAACLLAAPLWAQSRRRGYTPAGGWHRKTITPAPAPPAPRDNKKKNDKRPPQPPTLPAPTR